MVFDVRKGIYYQTVKSHGCDFRASWMNSCVFDNKYPSEQFAIQYRADTINILETI